MHRRHQLAFPNPHAQNNALRLGIRLLMNPDWEKQWRRKTSKIGISEYVIHVNPGLDQSQPGPTAGAKVLRGSILNKCRIYEVVHIAIVLV